MSANNTAKTTTTLSADLLRLPSIIEEVFGRALVGKIAPAVARRWKARILELDVIDTRTYLEGVKPGGPVPGASGLSVVVESERAGGYAAAIRRGRGGNYDYVGRRAAEEGLERAKPDIESALDRAGKEVAG